MNTSIQPEKPIDNKTNLKLRYTASLIGNFLRSLFLFLANLVLANKLGPGGYGDLNFLLTSFLSIKALLDLGTSAAFFTFISEKKRSKRFYLYYLGWLLFQFLFISLILVFICPDSIKKLIWLGHPTILILLAFFTSFTMNQLWEFATNTGESIRDTVGIQIRNVILSISYLITIYVLSLSDLLSLQNLLISTTALYLVCGCLHLFRLKNRLFFLEEDAEKEDLLRMYVNYCSPLALTTFCSFLYTFLDNWLLQNFGGALEQGYFSIGWKFSTIGLLATTAILKVFWKEIAEASENNNQVKVNSIFFKTSRSLFCFGCSICCFATFYSEEILLFFVGKQFQNAWLPMSLLLLYPIHQAVGQITTSYFQASGAVRTYRNIAIPVLLISLPISYFVLASKVNTVPGLELGAAGLAGKLLVLNFISVNIGLKVIQYKNGANSLPILYQIALVFGFLSIAYFAKWLSLKVHLPFLAASEIALGLQLTIAALIYISFCCLILYRFPSIMGLNQHEFDEYLRKTKSFFNLNKSTRS